MRARALVLSWLTVGCVEAWAQPRPRDAGVRRDAGARDAGVRRDAGARDAGARDASVDGTRPPTHGHIEAPDAQRVLATKRNEVRECYERGVARQPSLAGELTVRVRVEDDGLVSETSVGGDPALSQVGRCIEGVLRPLRFPRPTGGAATVTAPFVFRAAE